MEYNAYNELMSYFQFEFNVYIVLVVIVLVGVIKSIILYGEARKKVDIIHLPKSKSIYDLTISLLAVLGLANAMFFQGIIADIPMESGYVWLDKSLGLFMATIVLFIIQLVFMLLTTTRISKLKKGRDY